MRKLLILPGCSALGGTLVSLSLLIKGFEYWGMSKQLRVMVQLDSLMEKYLQEAGQGMYIKSISAPIMGEDESEFVKRSLQWLSQQPRDWPLLLDSCVSRDQILPILLATPSLRLSGRPIYHFFHDLAVSDNYLGNLTRKLTFTLLAPGVMCNSRFTAGYIRHLRSDLRGILYQPVDPNRFNNHPPSSPPPELQKILSSGDRLMLTPSRFNKPGTAIDKNLRALIPILVHLKNKGYFYHGVVIGGDLTPGEQRKQALLELAKNAGVEDRFTILPPKFDIENYYKYADVLVSLAPREPFGRTIVEAIACNVPVVGSRTGGIGEILQNFAPEWMVDPNDPVAAAETIIRIATEPNTSNILAQGKRWVEKECSVVNYARRIMEITGITPVGNSFAELRECF